MTEEEIKDLQNELKQFQKEKDAIKSVIGSIGGRTVAKRDNKFTALFITLITILFLLDTMRHLLHIDVPLPPLFSIEIGVLLVSIKIIWMMHKQMKVEHFQFWILHSIEFRINDIAKHLKRIDEDMRKHADLG